MSDVNLLDMYSRAAGEAFRLEAQQRYAVAAEDEQFRAFTEGRPMPSDPHVNRSMQIIRAATARGCRIRRVHVVDLPLTVYLRYELTAYRENIGAGEEVGIAVRSWHPDLGELTEDFVLFDPGSIHPDVVWMRYNDQGQVAGLAHSDKPADLALAASYRETALAHAVPLSEFMTLAEAG
ncbi:MAG: DUF6879 family protein [Streptosporangiaceae bacterium]